MATKQETTGPATLSQFSIVVAATENGGIGINGTLPWRLPGDMAFFKTTTSTTSDSEKSNMVIMGRKTWESIPRKFRPLAGRINVVLTKNPEFESGSDDVLVAGSLQEALALPSTKLAGRVESVYVIGGGSVYSEALQMNQCRRVYLTKVLNEFACDTKFPYIDPSKFSAGEPSEIMEENSTRYAFYIYNRTGEYVPESPVNAEEMQYIDMIRDIISTGNKRIDRTGTGTLSKFGTTMRFSLRDNVMPLLTTKRVFWRGVAEELLWFLSGDTSAKTLQDKNIKIWDGNSSREYLDSIGLKDREEGDLGPVYGFQWRHFGAEYKDMHTNYDGCGVDQVKELIHKIKNNPTDRRLILSAWNPAAIPEMALPPCHMFAQFYVHDGELSCQMYQRSADMGLGVPFNIASYSLLTYLIAQVCDLRPGEFIHVIGDAHVYLNHVDPLLEQIKREPRQFPTIHINPAVKDIDSFKFEDFEICGYKPYPTIKMEMSA